MKKTYLICSFIIYSTIFAQSKKVEFQPDVALTNGIRLLETKGIIQNFGNQEGKLIDDELPSRVIYYTVNKNQYLTMYHLAGGNANTFNFFEVGKASDTQLFLPCAISNFRTESGIELDMTIKTLIKIKGDDYKKKKYEGFDVISYNIKKKTAHILLASGMPEYVANYYFCKGKLIKFEFGFPNL